MGGGQVGEGVKVAMEGIDLLLDGGEVNRNGDVDVGHLSGGGRMNKECRED